MPNCFVVFDIDWHTCCLHSIVSQGYLTVCHGVLVNSLYYIFHSRPSLSCGDCRVLTNEMGAISLEDYEKKVIEESIALYEIKEKDPKAFPALPVSTLILLSLVITQFFMQITHNRHPIACPLGQAMGCLLWVQSLTCKFFTLVIVMLYVALGCKYYYKINDKYNTLNQFSLKCSQYMPHSSFGRWDMGVSFVISKFDP